MLDPRYEFERRTAGAVPVEALRSVRLGSTLSPQDLALVRRMAQEKGLRTVSPTGLGEVTYRQGRNFASSAGNLSDVQKMEASPAMHAQLTQFGRAMDEANRQAAETAGVGKEYGRGMGQYHRAMQLRDAGRVVKKAIPYAVGGGALGYGVRRALGDNH